MSAFEAAFALQSASGTAGSISGDLLKAPIGGPPRESVTLARPRGPTSVLDANKSRNLGIFAFFFFFFFFVVLTIQY